jgi:multiple antibiotic resistance protein
MNELISHAVTCFLGFFAIMNPIANTAAFVGLTADYTANERQKVAFKSLLTTFLIILVFSVLGNLIFQLFGITIHALRITGGILLFIIGYQMLHGEGSKMHSSTASHNMGIAVSPIAVPLLAGPGTIATAMNYAVSADFFKIVITLSAFLLLIIITYICFIFGQRLVTFIGNAGLSIITRLMGLIIAVIGVEMCMSGLFQMISHTFLN